MYVSLEAAKVSVTGNGHDGDVGACGHLAHPLCLWSETPVNGDKFIWCQCIEIHLFLGDQCKIKKKKKKKGNCTCEQW